MGSKVTECKKFRLVNIYKDEVVKTFKSIEEIVDYYKVPRKIVIEGIKKRYFFGDNMLIFKDERGEIDNLVALDTICGLTIHEILKKTNLTKEELAAEAGINEKVVRQLMCGEGLLGPKNKILLELFLHKKRIATVNFKKLSDSELLKYLKLKLKINQKEVAKLLNKSLYFLQHVEYTKGTKLEIEDRNRVLELLNYD